jgi:HEPN domain-containing protein
MAISDRSRDWLAQAKNDLGWAKVSLEAGYYSQVCFICQQAAKKALKAVAFSRGMTAVLSHSIRTIANELELNDEIEKAGKKLDLYYISARYPDGLPEGAPFESFDKSQADEAIKLAQIVLTIADAEIKETGVFWSNRCGTTRM